MDKFITTNSGGLPLRANDLRFIDDSIRNAFKGSMSSYGVNASEAIILSGCERSVALGSVFIAAGYISIGGEICQVPAHSYLVSDTVGKQEYWAIDTSWNTDGNKTFKNGISNETYQVRIGKVKIATTVPTGHTKVSDAKTYIRCITDALVRDTWKTAVSITLPPTDFYPGTHTISCYRDLDGFVHLKGKFPTQEDGGAGAVNMPIGTLPVGYRPAAHFECVLTCIQNNITGQLGTAFLEISTTGEMKITSIFAGYMAVMDYGQVPPFKIA